MQTISDLILDCSRSLRFEIRSNRSPSLSDTVFLIVAFKVWVRLRSYKCTFKLFAKFGVFYSPKLFWGLMEAINILLSTKSFSCMFSLFEYLLQLLIADPSSATGLLSSTKNQFSLQFDCCSCESLVFLGFPSVWRSGAVSLKFTSALVWNDVSLLNSASSDDGQLCDMSFVCSSFKSSFQLSLYQFLFFLHLTLSSAVTPSPCLLSSRDVLRPAIISSLSRHLSSSSCLWIFLKD